MNKRALLSVFDKEGIEDFARGLSALGFEILSTGGTATLLKDKGIPVTGVSEVTGFPECLDGRVKTLHPAIHAGILAMRGNPEHMKQLEELHIGTIDVVAINLYPFKATVARPDVTLEDAIENIDIGGPTMLRAAAKNWQDVAVVVDPADYAPVLDELKAGGVSKETKGRLAARVFIETAAYDALIAQYLTEQFIGSDFTDKMTFTYEKVQELRYGENPHQRAAWYKEPLAKGSDLCGAVQLHGKELSFNNINDTSAALAIVREMGDERPCAVAVKHANPCGVGFGGTLRAAYENAYASDPVSIYGGIVALSGEVDGATAQIMAETFLEVIVAHGYSQEALDIFTKKRNIRLLQLPRPESKDTGLDSKRVSGGLLLQTPDDQLFDESALRCVTKREPTAAEMAMLRQGYKVVKHVKSNAIVLWKGERTTGIGTGQQNRVTSLGLAIQQAGDEATGSVIASDAFFPFADSIELAKAAGITAVIQPGGSIHDDEVIAACDEAGIAMVFCGMRHFKH